jgi:TPR repeat protein
MQTILSFCRRTALLTGLFVTGAALAASDDSAPAPSAVTSLEMAHAALQQGRFAELEHTLAQVQADYEADTNAEARMRQTYRWFQIADPDLEASFDQWVDRYPQSHAARLARGLFLYAMARAWRGHAYVNKTHPKRMEFMDRYLERSYRDLEAASKLTEKPILAYATMISAARFVGGGNFANEVLTRAIKTDRYAVGPYYSYAVMLEPRWGGSHDAMHALAARADTEDHPKMKRVAKFIRSSVTTDQADAKYRANDRLEALKGYQEAVAISDENSYALCMLGQLYHAMGQTNNALASYNRALAVDPNDTNCMINRSAALHLARRDAAMLADLRQAASLGDLGAIRRLGFILLEGVGGIPPDVPEGLRWLERAAYFWDSDAIYQLGQTYERGEGVAPDHAKAVAYYRNCANLKNLMCQNNLGIMLWYGRGTPADQDEAARLWIRVHKTGDWHGRHNLEYFFSASERVRLAFRFGPGRWALEPLLTLAAIALGAIVIAWMLLRRRVGARRQRD